MGEMAGRPSACGRIADATDKAKKHDAEKQEGRNDEDEVKGD